MVNNIIVPVGGVEKVSSCQKLACGLEAWFKYKANLGPWMYFSALFMSLNSVLRFEVVMDQESQYGDETSAYQSLPSVVIFVASDPVLAYSSIRDLVITTASKIVRL